MLCPFPQLFTFFLSLFPQGFLNLREADKCVPCHTIVTYSLYLTSYEFLQSLLSTVKVWQVQQCTFSKRTTVLSLLGPVISLTTVFFFWLGLQYQIWIPSCEAGLKFSKKLFGYIYNELVIIAPGDPLSWWGQRCSMQGPQLSNTANYNCPPEVWTMPSNNLKASQKGASCHPSSSLISLCPVAKATGSYHLVPVWN